MSTKRGTAPVATIADTVGTAVFETLIEDHPYEGAAVLELAKYEFEQRGATPRTLGLARRAARFGGGDEAKELLSRLEAQIAPTRAGQEAGT